MEIIQIGNLFNTDKRDRQSGRVYALQGVSPTINTCSGGDAQPKIAYAVANRQRGVPPNTFHRLELGKKISFCITRINTDYMTLTSDKSGVEFNGQQVAIRKLTPWECLRLMGVSEENIAKAKASGISKTQWYKMAGNSIVVHQLAPIFEQLFYPTAQRGEQLKLF